jgi:hypothetical protein
VADETKNLEFIDRLDALEFRRKSRARIQNLHFGAGESATDHTVEIDALRKQGRFLP